MSRGRHFATLLAWCALGGSQSAHASVDAGVDVLVVAPHPDDEVLLAAGVIDRAVKAGQRVAVIVVTGGGYQCQWNPSVRESETRAAMTALGVQSNSLFFLGYPDGFISKLPLRKCLAPVESLNDEGICVKNSNTWTGSSLVGDVAKLLQALQPQDVYLPHSIDDHPDHAATYAAFRRAVDRLDASPPRIHRGLIHKGPCWPATNCEAPFAPELPSPPLPKPLHRYVARERVTVDANWKRSLIALYASQVGPDVERDWLSAFAKREELFYPEQLVRLRAHRWVRKSTNASRARESRLSFARSTEVKVDDCWLKKNAEALTLECTSEGTRLSIARWPLPDEPLGRVDLRIDARPDDGDVFEWSLWTRSGYLGTAVVAR